MDNGVARGKYGLSVSRLILILICERDFAHGVSPEKGCEMGRNSVGGSVSY